MQKNNKLVWFLFFILILIFLAIEFSGLKVPQPGDENVYFYMGNLVANGAVPYKDFFYAHPPLQLYVIAFVMKIFGFNIIALKSISLISAIITAVLIFKISKEKFGNAEALLSSLLFLFSYSVLFNSVFEFGIILAVMFLFLGLYFQLVKKNYFTAGIFFGIAGITRLLTLIPISIILADSFFKDKKVFRKTLTGFSIMFLMINLILIILFGLNYINPTYKYHILKSAESNSNFNEYINVIKLNWILFAASFLSIFSKDKKKLSLFYFTATAYLAFLIFSSRVFNFYFLVAIPFMAILGGCAVVELMKKIKSRKILMSLAILLAGVFLWDAAANIMFLEKIAFRGFGRGNDIADYLNTRIDKSYQIFGDESTTPLIALMTERKIIFNIVDTNPSVFKTGLVSLNDILMKLKEKKFVFIARNKQGISEFPEMREFLDKGCSLGSTFNDDADGMYLIYEC